MNKKTIAFFKEKFPRTFSMIVRSTVLSRIVLEVDRFNYWYCMLANKPYFGTIALAGQTWDRRKSWMRQLIRQEIDQRQKQNFHLLEIGSWAGDSAVLWADVIKARQGQGTVVCVDSWTPYIKTQKQEKVNAALILMDRLLRKRAVFQLFLHNVKASGHNGMIIPMKGSSVQVLPLLKEESFDVVFVDGDHSYSRVIQDLNLAARIVRDGGVMCGDDLDSFVDQIDLNYAKENREVNMVIDPQTQRAYHPGVLLAVTEFFKADVSSYDGFWAMRKVGNRWEKVVVGQFE